MSLGADGHALPVKDLQEPIDIFIPRTLDILDEALFQLQHGRMWNYHKIKIPTNSTALLIYAKPLSEQNVLSVLTRRDLPPTVDHFERNFTTGSQSGHSSSDDDYLFLLSDTELFEGVYYIAVKYLSIFHDDEFVTGNYSVNYTLSTMLLECVYWSEEQSGWASDGCTVSRACLNCYGEVRLR